MDVLVSCIFNIGNFLYNYLDTVMLCGSLNLNASTNKAKLEFVRN